MGVQCLAHWCLTKPVSLGSLFVSPSFLAGRGVWGTTGTGVLTGVTLVAAASSSPRYASDLEQARPQTSGEEELQLQLALAMSREEAEKVRPGSVCTGCLWRKEQGLVLTSLHLGSPLWTWRLTVASKTAPGMLVSLICPSHGLQLLVFSGRAQKRCYVRWCTLGACSFFVIREKCVLTTHSEKRLGLLLPPTSCPLEGQEQHL